MPKLLHFVLEVMIPKNWTYLSKIKQRSVLRQNRKTRTFDPVELKFVL
jgi:hypothetical protein